MRKHEKTTRRSWRDLQSRDGRQQKVVRRRRWINIAKATGGLVVLAAFCGSVVLLVDLWQQYRPNRSMQVAASPVQVEFQSSGVLDRDWFMRHHADLVPESLVGADLRGLRSELERREPQILASRVAVQLPDRLMVDIVERVPVLRVRVRGADGKGQVLLISQDGVLYSGHNYPQASLVRIPGAIGLRLQMEGDGYRQIRGMRALASFLEEARVNHPKIYSGWQIIDLSDWNPEDPFNTDLVRVRSTLVERLTFRLEGAGRQLRQLGLVLNELQQLNPGTIQEIDLSYGDEAIIKYE